MLAAFRYPLFALAAFPLAALSAPPVALSEEGHKPELGVIITQINWGRSWKCGPYENAQLQALTFTRSPADQVDPVTLDFSAPSILAADNDFVPYAAVVKPGEYLLTAFDVKVARSMSDVGHIKGTERTLVKDGKPLGGAFTVGPGEIVYIGHFGLDCGAEPFLWRYYIDGRNDFERYVEGFRRRYPFTRGVPVQFRLFSTQTLGEPFSLRQPMVE